MAYFHRGFTLAELLISLAILGIIATFTIPKLILAQSNTTYNSMAKEAASMISGAYQTYQIKNAVTGNTSAGDLTPYMNYVTSDSTTTIDTFQNTATRACGGSYGCIKLHNGAMMMWGTIGFNTTATTNAFYFYLDPDGKVTDGTTNGPGKSVVFWLYPNNRIRTYANVEPNTTYGGSTTIVADPTADPPWFSW